MTWFDLSGETIKAIGGVPTPHSQIPARVPLENVVGVSSEQYAEQILSEIEQDRAAEEVGPFATVHALAADSEH